MSLHDSAISAYPPFVIAIGYQRDVASGKRCYGLTALSDDEALQAISTLRRIASGDDAWPLPLHRISAIAVAQFDRGEPVALQLGALGSESASEAELLALLATQLAAAEAAGPVSVVGWNGQQMLWPLLESRFVVQGLPIPKALAAAARSDAFFQHFGGPAADGLSLTELAQTWGEATPASKTRTDLSAPLSATATAELEALLLLRLTLRLKSSHGLNTQLWQQALANWPDAASPPHLAALARLQSFKHSRAN